MNTGNKNKPVKSCHKHLVSINEIQCLLNLLKVLKLLQKFEFLLSKIVCTLIIM